MGFSYPNKSQQFLQAIVLVYHMLKKTISILWAVATCKICSEMCESGNPTLLYSARLRGFNRLSI